MTLALFVGGVFNTYANPAGGSTTPATLVRAAEAAPAPSTIDFESGLTAGQMIVGSLPAGTGVSGPDIGTVSITGVAGFPMIFDSECGGSADTCAGTSPQLFAPGLGQSLILAKWRQGQGQVITGDAAATIVVGFAQPMQVHSFVLHELEDGSPTATLLDADGGVVATQSIFNTGPAQTFSDSADGTVDWLDVSTIRFHLDGSGSLDNLVVSPMPDCPAGTVWTGTTCAPDCEVTPTAEGCPCPDGVNTYDADGMCPDEPSVCEVTPTAEGCPCPDGVNAYDAGGECPDEPSVCEVTPTAEGCPCPDGVNAYDADGECPDEPSVCEVTPTAEGCPCPDGVNTYDADGECPDEPSGCEVTPGPECCAADEVWVDPPGECRDRCVADPSLPGCCPNLLVWSPADGECRPICEVIPVLPGCQPTCTVDPTAPGCPCPDGDGVHNRDRECPPPPECDDGSAPPCDDDGPDPECDDGSSPPCDDDGPDPECDDGSSPPCDDEEDECDDGSAPPCDDDGPDPECDDGSSPACDDEEDECDDGSAPPCDDDDDDLGPAGADPENEAGYRLLAFLDDNDARVATGAAPDDNAQIVYELFVVDDGPRPAGLITVTAEIPASIQDVNFDLGSLPESCDGSAKQIECLVDFGETPELFAATRPAPRSANEVLTAELTITAVDGDNGLIEVRPPIEPSALAQVSGGSDDPFNDARKQAVLVFLLCIIALLLMLIIARQPTVQGAVAKSDA